MKILLINPPYTNFEGGRGTGGHMLPLGLGYLAGYLREKINCSIKILDAEIMGLDYIQIKNAIKEELPDIVGFTAPTPAINQVYKITELIKKEINPDCYITAGGIHPTVMPLQTMKESMLDSVVIGEGEITFFELVNEINNKTFQFNKVKGLFWRNKKAQFMMNQPRERIENLDILPFPARDLYNLASYYSAPTKKVSSFNATPILTSRGCAFNCTYCPSATIWKRIVKYRSAQNVIDEIEECIDKYNLREFNFFDDTFTLNSARVAEICQKIIDKKLDIAWISFSRVNTISEDLVRMMKMAGCKKISFGLESGSQNILDKMNKKATIEMARKAVEIVQAHGLQAYGSFMLGNVGETVETIQQTIDFAKSLDLDNATFFITTPYPGTQLYETAKQVNPILNEIPWGDFAPLAATKPILVQNNISANELIKWQKIAFKKFYFRPKYILHKLKQISSFASFKMIIDGLRMLFQILSRQYR